MCGIVGYSGSFTPDVVALANRTQAHRGPDDMGEYFDQSQGIGLGHVRLSILDLSPHGHQPMADPGGSVVLVYNGEIYNFLELRAELEQKGYRFRGHSDTEVLINLYLELGEEMLPRLNGIFAFALWDTRNRSLFLARDAMGVKPLYYTQEGDRFAFASEIKALLRMVPQAGELDAVALHRYLSFLWCPGEGTPLRNVRKLFPGEAMTVREGRITRRWVWYRLPVFQPQAPFATVEQAVQATEAALRDAVHRQLVADVPVGAFLSGGLDSSSIVAFARERVPDIRCFTIETDGGQEEGLADDLPYARKVAQHLGVPLDVVRIDAISMAADLENMVAQLDEPLADPAPLNVLYICQLARRQGVKVLLSGAGGDDLFTGYRRHLALSYDGYWQWLPQPVRSWLEHSSSRLDLRNPLFRRAAKLFNGASLNGDARIMNYFLWASEAQLHGIYTPEFLRELGTQGALEPMGEFLSGIPAGVAPLDRMLALEQRFFLTDHNLTYTDKMSMATGVEVRVPFLDLDLVDHAARVPVRLKQRGRTGKWVLKKAMEPYLPHDVIYRPKSGFGAPLRRWMRHELRPLLGDLLSVESVSRRGLFDPVAVQRMIAANDAGGVDASYMLLSLLCIEIWCRTYVDSVRNS